MTKKQRETNLDGLRDISITLLHAVPIKCNNPFGIIQHPFTNHMIAVDTNGNLLDLRIKSNEDTWKDMMSKKIEKADLIHLYMFLNKPWRITWLKFAEPYLSDKDFAEYLADAYVSEEMPNLNPNVPISEMIKWFKKADKKSLMAEEDYEIWSNLPDEVTLYRGVSHVGTEKAISWCLKLETAEWFANRFASEDSPAKIYQVTVPKKYCLCYFGARGENEIILDVNSVKKLIKQIV